MYNIDRKFLRILTQKSSNNTARKLCIRIENYEKSGLISNIDSKRLKQEIKDIIHEDFRDIENSIKFYNEGRNFKKYPIYSPTDK